MVADTFSYVDESGKNVTFTTIMTFRDGEE